MQEILNTVIFIGYTTQDVLLAYAAFLTLVLLLMRKFMRGTKKELGEYNKTVDCLGCGWHGEVSSIVGHCPKCNQTLIDQRDRKLPRRKRR